MRVILKDKMIKWDLILAIHNNRATHRAVIRSNQVIHQVAIHNNKVIHQVAIHNNQVIQPHRLEIVDYLMRHQLKLNLVIYQLISLIIQIFNHRIKTIKTLITEIFNNQRHQEHDQLHNFLLSLR